MKHAINAVSIPATLRKNKTAHYDYLVYIKDSLNMLRETVEEGRIANPLDSAIADACFPTNRSQELLEYAIVTCPKINSKQDRSSVTSTLRNGMHVIFDVPINASECSTSRPKKQTIVKLSNVRIVNSTGVKNDTKASGSKPSCNTKKDRTSPANVVCKTCNKC